MRYLPQAKRHYERKTWQRNRMVAMKAIAQKLARACYFNFTWTVRGTEECLGL